MKKLKYISLIILVLASLLVPNFVFPNITKATTVSSIQATKDNSIYYAANATNYGGLTYMFIRNDGGATYTTYGILEFTLPSLPSGAVITNCTLMLFYENNASGAPAGNFVVYKMLRPTWGELTSSWLNYKTGTAWATSGCNNNGLDYDSTKSASVAVGGSSFGWRSFNATNLVTDAYAGGNALELKLINDTASCTYYFWSREYATSAYRPQLFITYTYVPSVTTLPCTGFTSTSAILNGYISNLGTATNTQYGFDYGTSISYGSSVVTSGASLTTGSYFKTNITGLKAGTVYHFRAKSYNSDGWGYGQDQVFSTKGSPILYEYLNTGADAYSNIYGVNWYAQSFTLGTVSHTSTFARIPLRRHGTSPNTVTVSIRHATANLPTGDDIVSATLDGNAFTTGNFTWYLFQWASEANLQASLQYSLVVRANAADSSHYVEWLYDAGGGLANGTASRSIDGGITWSNTGTTGHDYLFELWGNPAIQVFDAKVYQDYSTTGDYLFVAKTQNTYLPYYPDYDASQYFSLQVIQNGIVKASSPANDWGMQPQGIYISPTLATSIAWAGNSTFMRLTLNGGSYSEYALVSTDWQGALPLLRPWCILTGRAMETYYSETFIVNTVENGICLNDVGGVYFKNGIKDIELVIPKLFQQSSNQNIKHTETNYDATTAGSDVSHEWTSRLGSYWTTQAVLFGNMFGMGGRDFLNFFFLAIWIILGAILAWKVNTASGLIAGLPLMVIDVFVGGLSAVPVGLILFILVIFAVRQFWWQTMF